MNDLVLRDSGVKGGNFSYKKKGYIEAQYGDNYIVVDNFEGRGDTYKPREQALISIRINDKYYTFTFKSLQYQLDKK